MLNWRYGRLAWRYLWRRFLTPAGRRWSTSGLLFFGRNLEIEFSPDEAPSFYFYETGNGAENEGPAQENLELLRKTLEEMK